VASRNVLNEIHFALEKNKPFLAVHLADVVLPDSLQLQVGRIQAVMKCRMPEDHYRTQLSKWLPVHLADPTGSAALPQEAVEVASPPPAPAARPGPTVQVPSFHYGGVVPPEFFIDREDELEEATRHIRAGQGFLLIGNRRAGKTSFCSKLIHQIMGSTGNDVLAVYLNLQQCVRLTIESFLEHTMLNIVGEMARQVFRCKYSDLLRADPLERNEALRNDAEFASFVEVVKRVIERTHTQQGANPSPLLAQEFIQFNRDLSLILRAKKWRRCVVFYDEANRLPHELSVDLLVSNEETLSSAGVVSVYAASPEMAQSFQELREAFGHHLSLGPFRTKDDLHRLLSRYYFNDPTLQADLPAHPAALNLLWSLSGGMPFVIQMLSGRSFRCAWEAKSSQVTVSHVEAAYTALRVERRDLFHGA
jgi:hypothetical protein